MGSKRVGLARIEALIENLKRSLTLTSSTSISCGSIESASTIAATTATGLGAVPATATAGSSATQLTEGIYVRVDSGDDGHKAKMFLASHAGQMVLVHNVDSGQDFILRNNADDATLGTLGQGTLAFIVSTASGDNWAVAGVLS
tara:strand:- start:54 stop:485 length:432 start_codon:yes stop_codon:yes gene_type:complete